MNCLDVCRLLATDPEHLNQKIEQHLQSCTQCTAYALQQKEFNQGLQQVMKIDVPSGLKARILLRQSIEKQNKKRFSNRGFFAIAASLLVTMGIGLTVVLFQAAPLLESVVLAHIKNEVKHLSEVKEINHRSLNNMLSGIQLSVVNKPVKMTYAGTCNIRKQSGAHFIVQGEHGRVTILIMPGEFVSNIKRLSDPRFNGYIYPTSYGSMAVVGESKENLDRVYKEFKMLVKIKS